MTNKSILFYIAAGLVSIVLLAYVISLLNILIASTSVVSETGPSTGQQVATFNLEKFKELKIAQ